MGIIDSTIKSFMRRVGYRRNAPVHPALKYTGGHYPTNPQNSNYGYQTTYNEYGYAQAYANVSAVFRSVELITNAIDQLDYSLYVGYGDDEQLVATSYDMDAKFNRALRYHRNEYGRDLISLITISSLLYDNVYIELLDNEYRIPSGFRWLNPLWVTLQRTYGHDADSFYFRYNGNSESFTLSRAEVAYDFGFNPYDDYQGMSRVLPVLDNADIDIKLKRFTQSFFNNGAWMAGILTPVADDAGSFQATSESSNSILQKQVHDWLRGTKNAFRLFMPNSPVNFQQITPPNIDQYYGIQDPIQREIFRVFGIPLELAGGDETRFKFGDDVYNAFMTLTVKPMVKRIENIINGQLLPFLLGNDDIRLVFDTSQFDSATEAHERQANILSTQLNATIITINEARIKSGLEADDTLDGLYMVGGTPVPRDEIQNLWLYQYGIYPTDTPPTALQGDLSDLGDDLPINSLAVKIPEKYAHIDFKPTESMASEAQLGLDWRSEYGRGGTDVGVARARDIANRKNLSPDTVKRMVSFFARHTNNAQAEGFERGEDGYPSNGRIAHALWGGDAGESWANERASQMETADNNAKKNVDRQLITPDSKIDGVEYEPETIDALNDLKKWGSVALKSHTKAFTPDSPLLAKYARVIRQDMIATNGDRDAIKTDIEWWQNEIKRQDILPIYKSMLTFRREIRRWLREAWLGETNNFNFQLDMSETISKEYRRGFRNGFRQFRPVSAITAEDDKLWEDQVRKDTNYLNELYNWVLLNDKASGGTWREVSKRGDKWLSRYDELFSLGQTAGARGKKLKWVINPAKESCVDCIRLAGRVYYADKWLEYDIRPQSARLACFGVFCGCKFVETDEPVTKGRPPKLVGSRR